MTRWHGDLCEDCPHPESCRAEHPACDCHLDPEPDDPERETQASIEDWRLATFGPAHSLARMAARANEEMAELLRAVTTAEPEMAKVGEECADVVILLYGVAQLAGVDLLGEVDAKMARNRARRWVMTDKGHGRHVGEEWA